MSAIENIDLRRQNTRQMKHAPLLPHLPNKIIHRFRLSCRLKPCLKNPHICLILNPSYTITAPNIKLSLIVSSCTLSEQRACVPLFTEGNRFFFLICFPPFIAEESLKKVYHNGFPLSILHFIAKSSLYFPYPISTFLTVLNCKYFITAICTSA